MCQWADTGNIRHTVHWYNGASTGTQKVQNRRVEQVFGPMCTGIRISSAVPGSSGVSVHAAAVGRYVSPVSKL